MFDALAHVFAQKRGKDVDKLFHGFHLSLFAKAIAR